MSEELTITIDGKPCTCERGEYLYDIARRNGIFIPTMCRNDEIPEHRASWKAGARASSRRASIPCSASARCERAPSA